MTEERIDLRKRRNSENEREVHFMLDNDLLERWKRFCLKTGRAMKDVLIKSVEREIGGPEGQ